MDPMSYTCDPGPSSFKSRDVVLGHLLRFLYVFVTDQRSPATKRTNSFSTEGPQGYHGTSPSVPSRDQRHPASNSPVFSGRKWGQDVSPETHQSDDANIATINEKHTSYKIPDNSPLRSVCIEVRVVFNIHFAWFLFDELIDAICGNLDFCEITIKHLFVIEKKNQKPIRLNK